MARCFPFIHLLLLPPIIIIIQCLNYLMISPISRNMISPISRWYHYFKILLVNIYKYLSSKSFAFISKWFGDIIKWFRDMVISIHSMTLPNTSRFHQIITAINIRKEIYNFYINIINWLYVTIENIIIGCNNLEISGNDLLIPIYC